MPSSESTDDFTADSDDNFTETSRFVSSSVAEREKKRVVKTPRVIIETVNTSRGGELVDDREPLIKL